MASEGVVERVAISIRKINELEYEISGSIDVDTMLKNVARVGTTFTKPSLSDKEKLGLFKDALIRNMKNSGVNATPVGEDFSLPDEEWLSKTIDKFLNDVSKKILSGGKEEEVVEKNFEGEKVKRKRFIHHRYEISAKCSSMLSNIDITLRNCDSAEVEDSLKIQCLQCVFGKNADGNLLCQYNPDSDTMPAYRTNLTYAITSSGEIKVEKPVIVSSRLIVIPDDKIGDVLEYDADDLNETMQKLAKEFSEFKVLPRWLDDIRFKNLRDNNGVTYPGLVLDDIKLKFRNVDGASEVDLARYVFNEAEYRYGEVILFEKIYESVDPSLLWSELGKEEQNGYIKKLETAVRSLNDMLARYFGLGDSKVVSMDKNSLGIRVNKKFFKMPKRKKR